MKRLLSPFHGITRFISARNAARRVVLPYLSKSPAESVICFIVIIRLFNLCL